MNVSFEEMKRKLKALTSQGIEPELRLYFRGKQYMIIDYGAYCSFQRCGCKDGSGEVNYQTLDELYCTRTIDGILLENDWENINDWECFEIEAFGSKD